MIKTGIVLIKLQRLTVFSEQRSLDPETEIGTQVTGMCLTNTMTEKTVDTSSHVHTTCSGDLSKHKAMISYNA